MPYVQRCCLLLCALSLAACASAPRDRHARTLNVPPPQKTVSVHTHQSLEVCPGMRVSNAPSADGNRRVVNYEPYSRVHGVTLARAPVDACVSSGFGPRHGGASGYHRGVDLYTRNPAPVYAGGDGVIEYIGTMRGYGYTLVIRHSETLKTRYAHLSSYAQGLRKGQRVREGDLIGRTGSTGNATAVHLHYEVLVDGAAQNPLTIGS
jgi:murein DD-endopeptidase MepM/ murein hydrolase activator NlpD